MFIILPSAYEGRDNCDIPAHRTCCCIIVYWGSYFRQTENARRLTVLIVDLDSAAAELSSSALSPSVTTGSYSAILGPIVVSTAQTYIQRLEHVNTTYWTLGYVFPPQDQISQFSLPLKNADGAIAYTTGVNASEWAMDLVLDQTYWAVVIINGNATMQALNSVSDGGNSYTRKCYKWVCNRHEN